MLIRLVDSHSDDVSNDELSSTNGDVTIYSTDVTRGVTRNVT